MHFDSEIPYRTLELAVPQQRLNSSKVLGALVDQRRFRSTHGVRAVK